VTAAIADLDSASLDSSWANELPPDEEYGGDSEPESEDRTELVNPPANVCPGCGGEIVREPGTRGRLPKYHPECKPTRGSTAKSGTRVVRVSKAEEKAALETAAAIEVVRRNLFKAAMMVAMVDPFDGMCILISAPDVVDNLEPVFMRFPKFRGLFLTASTGGSIGGLIMALAAMLLPILAHHGLVPSKKLAQILLNLPMFIYRIQKRLERLEDGGESRDAIISEFMTQAQAKARADREAAMRAATVESSIGVS